MATTFERNSLHSVTES